MPTGTSTKSVSNKGKVYAMGESVTLATVVTEQGGEIKKEGTLHNIAATYLHSVTSLQGSLTH